MEQGNENLPEKKKEEDELSGWAWIIIVLLIIGHVALWIWLKKTFDEEIYGLLYMIAEGLLLWLFLK